MRRIIIQSHHMGKYKIILWDLGVQPSIMQVSCIVLEIACFKMHSSSTVGLLLSNTKEP